MKKFKLNWLLGALLIGFTGCASFASFGAGAGKNSGDPSKRYQVEMANMVGGSSVYEGQLEENMRVQHALEKSGAVRRYRMMDVSVLRIVEGTGQPLRLPVQYDGSKKQVSPEQDYALLPGDRVIVEPSTGLLDRLTKFK